jgi:plasmid stabilization system protein ParE
VKKYRFLTPALLEAETASTFYESNRADLGSAFLDELDATIQRIVANPRAWQVLDGEIRRCRLRRFPYGVVYTIEDESILIISVMHLHRHPLSWRQNLSSESQN